MAYRPLIFRRRSLAYPAWLQPGFNPAHPMATAAQLSAVFFNGTFLNLAPGYANTIGTIAGTAAQKIDGILGPCKDVGTSYDIAFTGGTANATGSPVTMAAIVKPGASENAGIFTYGTTGPLIANFSGPNGPFYFSVAGADVSSGITLTAGVPYFVVASWSGVVAETIKYLVLNLNTGAILTAAFATGGATNTYAGTGFTVGFTGKYSDFWSGQIAAVFASKAAHGPAELRAWAEDPWGFWYPDVSVNYFKTPSTGVVETDTYSPPPRTYPLPWNTDARLLRNITQDASSFGVETNPHWRGRAFPTQWNTLRALMQNSDPNAPFAQPETNTYFVPRTVPVLWKPMPLARTTAQDFSSFGVETNPHWSGRIFPLQWNIKRDWAPPQDTSSFGVETNPHWAGRQWPIQWNLTLKLRQTDTQDLSSFGVETNPPWMGRFWPMVWTPLQSLARLAATDVTPPAIETNVYFTPRTWPLQWNLQASLMRGAAQDFSSVAPAAQFQYLMNIGGMNIGLNNPSNANSLG